MSTGASRRPWSYPLRRAVAFCIDFLIAQFAAQLLLNLADLPVPGWTLALFLPCTFVALCTGFMMRDRLSRTIGKRIMGLAVQDARGGRPASPALWMRTSTLAFLVLVDWPGLLSGAMTDPTTFGTMLVVTMALGLALVSLTAVRQIRDGGATPHDALARTQVVWADPGQARQAGWAARALSASAVSAVIGVAVVVFLFTTGILLVTAESACPVCRQAERVIESRLQMPVRVDVNESESGTFQTTVWMPVLSSLRGADRTAALATADSIVTASAAGHGLDPTRRSIVQQINQFPISADAIHYAAPETQDKFEVRFGFSGQINFLRVSLALSFSGDMEPVEDPYR